MIAESGHSSVQPPHEMSLSDLNQHWIYMYVNLVCSTYSTWKTKCELGLYLEVHCRYDTVVNWVGHCEGQRIILSVLTYVIVSTWGASSMDFYFWCIEMKLNAYFVCRLFKGCIVKRFVLKEKYWGYCHGADLCEKSLWPLLVQCQCVSCKMFYNV